MLDEQKILTAERLRDDVADFRKALRSRYSAKRQVTSEDLRKKAAVLAETWLVELVPDEHFVIAVGATTVADLTVHFQRILTYSEHATLCSRYEAELKSVLANFATTVVLPLKQARGKARVVPAAPLMIRPDAATAFVGQSFSAIDEPVNSCVRETLEAIGVRVVTGEKPRADLIAEKVKRLIDDQALFVGIFTRRDKIVRKNEFTTSAWVLDEKAYATAKKKRLVLIKEQGVGSIGGIQGDYEYIEFSRSALQKLCVGLLHLFDIRQCGLRR